MAGLLTAHRGKTSSLAIKCEVAIGDAKAIEARLNTNRKRISGTEQYYN